tara:strand:- start:379 stop:2112 length:1734 start_codon:yes stop_codon:yes gene_type:complete
MGNSDALQALSILTNALSKAHSVNVASRERRLDREYRSEELDESREYELKKLDELRDYNEKIHKKEKEYDWTKMLTMDSISKKDRALDDFYGVEESYRSTLGIMPNRSKEADNIIKNSYKGEVLDFESFMEHNNNTINTLHQASKKIRNDLTTLNMEAANFLSEYSPDYMNRNIKDYALDKPEFEMMQEDFVSNMRQKGIEDTAAAKMLSNLFYATPLEDRLKIGRAQLKKESQEYIDFGGQNLLNISSALFPSEPTDASRSFRKDIGDKNYEILLNIFSKDNPEQVYRQLETFPMGTGVATDYLDSKLESLPPGIAMQITAFINNMKTHDSIMNPSTGSVLANMGDIVEKLPEGDTRSAISKVQAMVQDMDPEVQFDHFNLLGEELVDKWGITFESYEKSLDDMLLSGGSNEGSNAEILKEALNSMKENFSDSANKDENSIKLIDDTLDLIKKSEELSEKGKHDEALKLLDKINIDNNNQINEVPLKVGQVESTDRPWPSGSELFNRTKAGLLRQAVNQSPSLKRLLDGSKKGNSWKQQKVASLIEDWNNLIDNNIEEASIYGSFEDYVKANFNLG